MIAQTLQPHCPGAANSDKAALHIGAVAFIHRFGSSLNEHVHFHVCVVDGVFDAVAGNVIFHPASGIDSETVAQAEATLRQRILRAFVGRGLLESLEAKEMLGYKHSGFSVDAGVCIEANDRAGLERLLRYCARPPFAMERLRKAGSELVYRCGKATQRTSRRLRTRSHGRRAASHATGADRPHCRADSPPRLHRHRYFGVLAPNSPLRDVVTAMAAATAPVIAVQAKPYAHADAAGDCAHGTAPPGHTGATASEPAPAPPPKRPAHYLWAVLIARIYEVLLCARSAAARCASSRSSRTASTYAKSSITSEWNQCRPTLPRHAGHHCGMTVMRRRVKGQQIEPDWDLAPQPAPDYEVDQRISW